MRNQLFPPVEIEHNIPCNLNELSCINQIDFKKEEGAVFIAGGVFYYFETEKVKRIITSMAEKFPGEKIAMDAGRILKEEGYDFDICYTSYLKRAIHTLNYALDEMNRTWLPVIKTWKLNERHYGKLQGLNKAETAKKYGEDQVKIWRRSYDVKPPLLDPLDLRNPRLQEQYRQEVNENLPLGESLEDTIDRVVPYYNEYIRKDMELGKE